MILLRIIYQFIGFAETVCCTASETSKSTHYWWDFYDGSRSAGGKRTEEKQKNEIPKTVISKILISKILISKMFTINLLHLPPSNLKSEDTTQYKSYHQFI